MDSSPITQEHVEEWASYGQKLYNKPTTPEEIATLKQRKQNIKDMKKRLAVEINDKLKWSERAIERELNRLVLLEQQKEQQHKSEENENEADDDNASPTRRPPYQLDNNHPDNIVDYRSEGGPLMNMLWCNDEPLVGQTLYLGGEVGADGNIYCIPGHAGKVLKIDTTSNKLSLIGPELKSNIGGGVNTSNGRLYKWLRGIVVGNIIYGLPCHADDILRIDVSTQTITKIPIPYEEFYNTNPEEAKQQREMIWKYHGGNICPIDNCIYAIPQSAHHVLKIDPTNETITFVGPELPGRWKWYGGILGKQDGAIYGIPHNSNSVLRIEGPDKVTLHGDFGDGNHKWHGGAAASNGVIVSVPANSDSVLLITPGSPEPKLEEIGNNDVIKTGRHRNDGKYKYLGAMCGTNGKVYVFPCASEYVLQVDTSKLKVKNVGPNLLDSGLELVNQNKYQNGLTCIQDKCVYGMPLSGHTLLRIDCSNCVSSGDDGDVGAEEQDNDVDPIITTWKIPTPRRDCRDKFEGGVIIPETGVMYTVPNNHKAVLRIESSNL